MRSSHRLNLFSKPFFYGQHLLMISCKYVSQINPRVNLFSDHLFTSRSKDGVEEGEAFTGGEARGCGAETRSQRSELQTNKQNCHWRGHKWTNMFSLSTRRLEQTAVRSQRSATLLAVMKLQLAFTVVGRPFVTEDGSKFDFFPRVSHRDKPLQPPPPPANFLSCLRASQLQNPSNRITAFALQAPLSHKEPPISRICGARNGPLLVLALCFGCSHIFWS